MGSLDQLILDLRNFEGRKEVLKQLRREIRKPVPKVRRAVRGRAVRILPSRGGLGPWVASSRISATLKVSNRSATLTLRGGRRSGSGKKSDLRRIDQGKVRHPSWGRRGRGDWHVQTVPSGFFTDPMVETDEWRKAALDAVDNALRSLR